ncbi:MAG: YdcF family protein [Candidatus Saccharimonadales bacterium]
MKFLLLFCLALIVLIITSISAYLSPDDLRACKQQAAFGECSKVDAIVAVSGGDTNARADEAIQLYKAGWAPRIIFSGAAADPTGPSNAEIMSRRATNAGVPETAVVTEEFSRTTAENALNTNEFIKGQSIKNIILVTSAYHQRRASLEFSSILGPSVAIVNHPVATDKDWVGFWWWTTTRGWWLAGGELIKILAFFGDQEVNPL